MRCKTKLNNTVPLEMCLEQKDSLQPHKEMCHVSRCELNPFYALEQKHSLQPYKEMCHVR